MKKTKIIILGSHFAAGLTTAICLHAEVTTININTILS